ncbi:unnamed protein product [Dracunculus medinensis]|uniref:Uncharacterized protein n=1 Tax=Dracunculus medinensis TaxID=318479 RepID=A0A158Q2N5_DRAME|nr:unnamed protein product [Dracunculus medinensis]
MSSVEYYADGATSNHIPIPSSCQHFSWNFSSAFSPPSLHSSIQPNFIHTEAATSAQRNCNRIPAALTQCSGGLNPVTCGTTTRNPQTNNNNQLFFGSPQFAIPQ